jgi:AraC family transcriptional regulator of adaptative response/methylated-DNA-[protein]-cysteine methyltransferase
VQNGALAERPLPSPDEMFAAILVRDTSYDGIFFTAVKTTGIFCRPSCPARKPARENIAFYRTAAEALELGFRPCKKCRPLEPPGQTPEPVRRLLEEVEEDPTRRLNDDDLRARGHDPVTLRRWFKEHHGMTFHAYQRSRRLAWALGEGAVLHR